MAPLLLDILWAHLVCIFYYLLLPLVLYLSNYAIFLGTRVLVTLLNALRTKGLKRGVASLCVGGGMGVALAVELV